MKLKENNCFSCGFETIKKWKGMMLIIEGCINPKCKYYYKNEHYKKWKEINYQVWKLAGESLQYLKFLKKMYENKNV